MRDSSIRIVLKDPNQVIGRKNNKYNFFTFRSFQITCRRKIYYIIYNYLFEQFLRFFLNIFFSSLLLSLDSDSHNGRPRDGSMIGIRFIMYKNPHHCLNIYFPAVSQQNFYFQNFPTFKCKIVGLNFN